jgi:signal transduction histidine kinase
MLLTPVPPTNASIDKAAKDAFHRQIGLINQPRLAPLQLVLGGLLLLSALIAYISSPPTIWDYTSAVWLNLFGAMMCGLVLLLLRVSSPRVASLAYGYAILGWGNNELFRFVAESRIRHADHAGEALLIYYITRYLAGLGVVWRPRDLGIALALNHILLAVVFYWQGQTTIIINFAVWTTTAWLASYLLYRAERSAFIAGAQLKAQNAELAQANARLEQLNNEKTDLMAIAAHDLRSPLMGMTMLLNVTADEAARVWQAGVGSLRALEQSCKEMADLVSRVLDVHRTADAVGQLTLQPREIQPTIAKVTQAHDARARAKDITLSVEARPSMPPVMHDPQALERVLDNLISNAVKFTPPGGAVVVRVSCSGTVAAIAVSDSGPGIADADRPLLFRKFARLRPRPTAGESSSGLGLYITKQLVEAMGGDIAVSAAAGRGATFTVTLAAAPA